LENLVLHTAATFSKASGNIVIIIISAKSFYYNKLQFSIQAS